MNSIRFLDENWFIAHWWCTVKQQWDILPFSCCLLKLKGDIRQPPTMYSVVGHLCCPWTHCDGWGLELHSVYSMQIPCLTKIMFIFFVLSLFLSLFLQNILCLEIFCMEQGNFNSQLICLSYWPLNPQENIKKGSNSFFHEAKWMDMKTLGIRREFTLDWSAK